MQQLINNISDTTGFAISLGWVDSTREIGIGSGPRDPVTYPGILGGTTHGNDTMLLGSGTKPFTAAAVFRLIEAGVVALDDLAYLHLDRVIQPLANASFVELFPEYGGKITIRMLLNMQSGIADFDVSDYDNAILKTGNETHHPIDIVKFASTLNSTCSPGNCTSYSSTNYVLLGFVLLAHQKQTGPSQAWTGLNLPALLGDIPGVHFATDGPLNQWLSVGGESIAYGTDEILNQDASILGWTCGNVVSSGLAIARFYDKLLRPGGRQLSAESVAVMTNWSLVSVGWAANNLKYGAGLMIQEMSLQNLQTTYGEYLGMNYTAGTYIGHAGDTYAFMSDNGFVPFLNASFSVIVNQDYDFAYPSYVVSCAVLQLAARYAGHDIDYKCTPPERRSDVSYECQHMYGQAVCVPQTGGQGTGMPDKPDANHTQAACAKMCH